jgi:hypothetical protein
MVKDLMDSLIEKYLRDTGIEMRTWKKDGSIVNVSSQEKIIHSLLASYVNNQLNNDNEKNNI